MKKSVLLVALSIALVSFASMPAAQAGEMGSIVDEVRMRFLGVIPNESGELSAGGTSLPGNVELDSDLVPELDLTHKFNENVAAELILATSQHSVNTKETGGYISSDGKENLGDVSLLPPTLMAQYHFKPDDYFQPYVGAGLNYTLFYNEGNDLVDDTANSVDYDNSAGWALQAGFDVQLDSVSDRMALNVDLKKLYLNTDVSVNDGAVKADVDIDPLLFGVGISYEI